MPRVVRAYQYRGVANDRRNCREDILRLQRTQDGQAAAIRVVPRPIEIEHVRDDFVWQVSVRSKQASGRVMEHVNFEWRDTQIDSG